MHVCVLQVNLYRFSKVHQIIPYLHLCIHFLTKENCFIYVNKQR